MDETNLNDDPLGKAVKELFGLSYLFPYQRLVISNILEAAASAELSDREGLGKQIVILPTGAGKSLCFQLPAMLIEGATLVIYPILGLMADQERRLKDRGFSAVVLRGGQTKEEREEIFSKIKNGKGNFIIANPEVLLASGVFSRLRDLNIKHIVIDEAHCVSEWGESFRPSYLEIHKIIQEAGSPLITAFTATAGTTVLNKIEKYIFGEEGAARIVGNPDRKNISYHGRGCIVRNLAVRDYIVQNQRPAIVFCSTRPGTERLSEYLKNEIFQMDYPWYKKIRYYHAGLSREEKKETEDWFLNDREAVLCATCAYGLGIDKPDIRTVIHRDCPPSIEAYLQESGRAGRDGELSKAVILWGPEDEASLSRVKKDGDRARMSKLLSYARDGNKCRREALLDILEYQGERDYPEQNCCDVCSKTFFSGLREEKSLLDFFKRNRNSYTLPMAINILKDAKVNWNEDDASEAISYLIKTGKIIRSKNPFFRNLFVARV